MKILHYSLGFPPYRRGGMTKYCLDLMVEQNKAGHYVAMLWPGMIVSYTDKSMIVKRNKQYIREQKFVNYEIINPLPVSLLNGIEDIDAYTQNKRIKNYVRFFERNRFDILHIHTLMGLPIEIIHAAKKANCKIVYTSHDYFGICPKISLVIGNQVCTCSKSHQLCDVCNRGALSLRTIKLIQSPIYRILKNNSLVKRLRKSKLDQHMSNSTKLDTIVKKDMCVDKSQMIQYSRLQNYYYECFRYVDFIHFNSTVTASIFKENNVPIMDSKVITISHSGINFIKKSKRVGPIIRIGYMGGYDVRKGSDLLLESLDALYLQGYKNFSLSVFGKYPEKRDYMIENEPYSYDQLPDILDSLDLVVLPSIWFETFGFTVLEALSRCVPVLVSENAGCKDIVQHNEYGIIFSPEKDKLEQCLEQILTEPKLIEKFNSNINNSFDIVTMEKHSTAIMNEYVRIVGT